MKAYATILVFFLMTFWFSNSLGSVGLSPVIQTGATEGHSYAEMSGSMIRILNPQNQSATVLLDSQLNLTWMTIGSSTIINPPIETRNKFDANLLNLTALLTEGYLNNNQTNVIMSLSERNAPVKPEDDGVFSSLIANARTLCINENAHTQLNLLAGRLNYTAIFELAENPKVTHIWLDRNFHVCLDQSVPLIKNPQQWTQIESSFGKSINGTGIIIAILDTGIDSTHPDFSFPNGTSKIVGAVSFTGEPTSDAFGHGTHCASIAAGTGAASSYEYVGVAPGASLLNVKVLDNTGQGQEDWIISGIQWAVDNKANVLSMSLGTDVDGDGSDPLSTAVNGAVNQGAVCVVAAGNSGPQMYTLGIPGVAGLAITVGASSKSDVIADFSSNGPTSDYRIKPDVVAPGVDIVAARANGTSIGAPVSDYYTMASGTSMAAPHVAGAAALLLDAHPSWNPTIVKTALSNYAQDIGANVLAQGSGRIDVCQAVNASIVGNSSLSFGKVDLNTACSCVVTLQNLASRTVDLALNSYAWSISDGTPYDLTSLSTSSLTLASGATGNVELTLTTNGALQDGYYEGNVTATFNGANIRIPIFFCILSQLNVQVTDEKGSTLMSSFVLINATSTEMQAYFLECSSAEFTVPPGDYIVQAMNIYGSNPALGTMDTSISFLIFKEVTLGTAQTINLQLSLSSTYKLPVRSTDVENTPLHLVDKKLYNFYAGMEYLSNTLGQYANQYIYLTDISDYLKGPCFFGFAGFPQDYNSWNQTGTLTSQVDMYFVGWDLSTFGPSNMPAALNFTNSELATFNIDTMLPESSPVSTIWFTQIAGMWQSGFWYGYQTHPGILWKTHILPYQYRTSPSANWSQLEWSCIYAFSTNFGSAEDYVIDRHFQPITKGEDSSYSVGKTPLLPQDVVQDPPDVGSGLYVPYYPLRIEKNLFIDETGLQATKRLEVFENGNLIDNETSTWSQAPIPISQFLDSYGPGLYTFVVKTNTSFNYSSQNVAEYTINYTSTSTDLIPPSITEVDCEPCFTRNDHPVEIQLADNDGITSVSLFYSTDNAPYLPAALTNLGNNYFSADLTLPTGAQKLSLIVEASDGNGNKIRFTTDPAATRGYKTRIDASVNGGTITGKLTVIRGSLLQPVYLKVESNGQTWYTLTDANGNFAFNLPPSIGSQIDIEMSPTGTYDGSSWANNFLSVQTEPAGIVSIPGGGWYTQATDAVLTAPGSVNVSSSTRYNFNYWDVDGTPQGSGVNPITVLMNANHTATAHYTSNYTLTIETTTGGSTNPLIGNYSLAENSTMQVTAIANAGYTFDHWELDTFNVGSTERYPVLMDSDHTLRAVFKQIPPTTGGGNRYHT